MWLVPLSVVPANFGAWRGFCLFLCTQEAHQHHALALPLLWCEQSIGFASCPARLRCSRSARVSARCRSVGKGPLPAWRSHRPLPVLPPHPKTPHTPGALRLGRPAGSAPPPPPAAPSSAGGGRGPCPISAAGPGCALAAGGAASEAALRLRGRMAEPPAPLTRAAAGGGRGDAASPPCRESQPCGTQRHGLMDHLQASGVSSCRSAPARVCPACARVCLHVRVCLRRACCLLRSPLL